MAQEQRSATVGEPPPAFSLDSFTTSGKVVVHPGQVTLVFFGWHDGEESAVAAEVLALL